MDPDNKELSESERVNTYADVFNNFAFGKPSLSFPRLILIGGQPGAGKSRIAEKAERELEAIGAPVEVDIDETRPYYPDVEKVFVQTPFKMSAITNVKCWGWTSHLLLDARHTKNNVIYQATIRNAGHIEDLIKDFQKEGFAVDMYVVAANARDSIRGIFNRFEIDIQRMSEGIAVIPRWVPIPFHNQVYRAFPKSVDFLAENARLERVGVFERDGSKLYFSEDQLIHRGAGEAVLNERNREWSQDERDLFRNGWKKLLQRIEERPEGILKPKWYVNTARLYCLEAEYLSQATAIVNKEAPYKAVVERRTPNHIFIRSESGELDCYLRAVRAPLPEPSTRAPTPSGGTSPR